MSKKDQTEFRLSLTDDELGRFSYDWPYNARPQQLAPPDIIEANGLKWLYWVALAGRGFGKTRMGSEWVRKIKEHCGRIAIVAETAADARDVIVDGESGLMACSPPWDKPLFEPSKRRITFPNGAYATLYSGEDPEQLRGPQHSAAWVDEFAKFRYAKELWDQLKFGLRIRPKDGSPPRAMVTTTPKPIEPLKKLIAHPRVVVTRGSTYDNLENLAEEAVEELRATYEGTTLGMQELHAAMLDEAKGALWTRAIIEENRINFAHNLKGDFWRRTVVGVDPQSGKGRNSTGIIAVSLGADGHGYVRGDATGNYLPAQWAKRVAELAAEVEADEIVAEGNQGGEMVRHVIHSHDPKLVVNIVHARQGKQARAEPVASLYEQGRVHHIGTYGMLESQMVTWEPESGDASPDRIDALVWACRRLLVSAPKPRGLAAPETVAVR